MADYTQANRPIRVDTNLGTDVLLLSGFNGLEAVSHPYNFQLDMLSTDPDIDPASILRTPVLVTISVADEDKRYVHGICSRIAQGGMRDDLASYRAEIVPWLWFLTLSRESRIYQELSVPDILELVFKRAGYSDFEFRLKRGYPKRLFCVQYRESHFAFVSRLMEEEGIFYFFEHSEEKHLLVLTDDSSVSAPVVGPESIPFSTEGHTDEYVVSELEREHKVYAGRMTLWEYDYLKPTTKLAVNQGEEAEEVYDYPGGYREHDEGDHKARLLLEAQEAERDIVRGGSTATGLEPGFSFKLEGHFHRDMNGKYFLTQVQHMAQAGAYRAWENEAGLDYHNTFLCIPDGTPFRPHRRTPRPVIQGSQSALVVGPAGAEVHTDSHGRIKVHFYWDRDSQKDEKSSCWIRVSTPWGGKGWGAVSIPRIGNEVLVAFEEGDPDRPIIIGSVYNADQTPPFALPGADIQMGMKSRSSPGGGGMNEITMTDTKGKELMNVHAQYDMVTKVLHDDTQTIVNDRTIGVTGKHTETITKDTSVTISEGNYTFKVSTGTGSFDIKGKVTETYHATQDTTVKGNITIKSTTGAILVQAANEIKLHTGDSAITLKKDGTITIQGKKIQVIGADEIKESAPKVAISATDEAKFGVSSQLITCDKAKVNTAGAAINASAVGMHEITGAVVKIN